MPTPRNAVPLIAKVQKAPDAAWGPLLDELEEAKRGYDPEAQTSGFSVQTGRSQTYRTSSSGGPKLLAESDEGKESLPEEKACARSYLATSSGGVKLLGEPDGGKETVPDHDLGVRSYRVTGSGGMTLVAEDGGKDPLLDPNADNKPSRPASSGGAVLLRDTGKETLPDLPLTSRSLRAASSGGATAYTDDGGKES